MKEFSNKWKKSKKPSKQRKYVVNAPLHKKQSFIVSTLSKELRKTHNKRNMVIRKDDKVQIMRGSFKKKEGNVSKVDLSKMKVYVEGIENVKKDGSKSPYPLNASNLMIIELSLVDKKRKQILERKGKNE
ncbi:50S ribosomal protein L24 [archaeon]|nr:50S ribosomal protein L24 [archaeon]